MGQDGPHRAGARRPGRHPPEGPAHRPEEVGGLYREGGRGRVLGRVVARGEFPVSMDPALEASYGFCSEIARREARNFYFAFRLLPPQGRLSMCALYAFMRHTDDLADENGPAAGKEQALAAWKDELDSAIAGGATRWPGLSALADTVARCGIPASLLHEVIEGVSMDID